MLNDQKLFNNLAKDFGPASGNFGSALLFIYGLAIGSRAKNILEIGHGLGGSAAALLLAAEKNNGFVTSIDIKQESADWHNSLVKNPGLSARWKFIRGNSIEILPTLPSISYDLILIDGEHSYKAVQFELVQAKRLTCKGGARILLDDCWKEYAPGVVQAFEEFDTWRPYEKHLIQYGTTESFDGVGRTIGLIRFLD